MTMDPVKLNTTLGELYAFAAATGLKLTPDDVRYQITHYNEDRAPALYAGSIALITITAVCVALRLFARKVKKIPLGADDYMVLTATTFAWGMFVAMICCIHFGYGEHILRAGIRNLDNASRSVYVFEILYVLTCLATKFSLLLLYRRIFGTANRAFSWAWAVIATLILGWTIASLFVTILQCLPIKALWSIVENPKCLDLVLALGLLGLTNTLLNIAIIILPLPMVWRLSMNKKKKLALCGIFLLGGGDIGICIARTYYVSTLDIYNIDITWRQYNTAILGLVEQLLGIICACLPLLRPLVGLVFGDITSSDRSLPWMRSYQSTSNTSPPTPKWPALGPGRHMIRIGMNRKRQEGQQQWQNLDHEERGSVTQPLEKSSPSSQAGGSVSITTYNFKEECGPKEKDTEDGLTKAELHIREIISRSSSMSKTPRTSLRPPADVHNR